MLIKSKFVIKIFSICMPIQAVNLFGVIFYYSRYSDDNEISDTVLNHEKIHTEQYRETFYIFYIPLYLLNFTFNLVKYCTFNKAYRNICFEREAYRNHDNDHYISERRPNAWIGYITGD